MKSELLRTVGTKYRYELNLSAIFNFCSITPPVMQVGTYLPPTYQVKPYRYLLFMKSELLRW
jgi:hypothetical protein